MFVAALRIDVRPAHAALATSQEPIENEPIHEESEQCHQQHAPCDLQPAFPARALIFPEISLHKSSSASGCNLPLNVQVRLESNIRTGNNFKQFFFRNQKTGLQPAVQLEKKIQVGGVLSLAGIDDGIRLHYLLIKQRLSGVRSQHILA